MSLDAVRALDHSQTGVIGTNGAYAKATVFENWKDWPPSNISHHGHMCCDIAREWITATDYSSLNGGNMLSGPRWLRHRFEWGPSTYPVYWCEAVRRKTLDCGALAALAHETFTIRGVKSYRVQLVQRFSRSATDHWSDSWHSGDASRLWINNDVIYHEGCAVTADGNELKVWDAMCRCGSIPKPGSGYGALLAIRVSRLADPPTLPGAAIR